MFEFLKERRRLSRLQKDRQKLDREWAASIKAARLAGQSYHVLMKEHAMELEAIDEEIALETFNHFVRQAHKLIIPLPDLDDETMWYESHITQTRRLSAKAIHELRGMIRKERKERIEFWTIRISSATGLIGTLIGLVTVLKR